MIQGQSWSPDNWWATSIHTQAPGLSQVIYIYIYNINVYLYTVIYIDVYLYITKYVDIHIDTQIFKHTHIYRSEYTI